MQNNMYSSVYSFVQTKRNEMPSVNSVHSSSAGEDNEVTLYTSD